MIKKNTIVIIINNQLQIFQFRYLINTILNINVNIKQTLNKYIIFDRLRYIIKLYLEPLNILRKNNLGNQKYRFWRRKTIITKKMIKGFESEKKLPG